MSAFAQLPYELWTRILAYTPTASTITSVVQTCKYVRILIFFPPFATFLPFAIDTTSHTHARIITT